VSEAEAPSAEQLVAELQKAKVADLILHTCTLLASMGFGKLAPEARDLDDARLAIDALKALVALVPAEARRDIEAVVANLQLAYAGAVAEATQEPETNGGEE
jgi:hypothetical protein